MRILSFDFVLILYVGALTKCEIIKVAEKASSHFLMGKGTGHSLVGEEYLVLLSAVDPAGELPSASCPHSQRAPPAEFSSRD